MPEWPPNLAPSDLRALASDLMTGRLCPPYPAFNVQRTLSGAVAPEVSAWLQELSGTGMPPAGIARTLELLAAAYETRPPIEDLIDVVTTGPVVKGVTNRDTSVVVGELFRNAQTTVLVAGYAVYQGQKVFQALADRMAAAPSLKVRLCLDIQRKQGDTTVAKELVAKFKHRFRTTQWPSDRPLPEVYYDPRSLAADEAKASLHAKCIVVDGFEVFVSSANFTEAAQQRNIEVGVHLHSEVVASRIERFFGGLIQQGQLVRVL